MSQPYLAAKNNKLQQKLNLQLAIIADPHLSNGAKVVAICLLFRFHNTKTGHCFPSNTTVGAVVGMRPRTVIRHIMELVKQGYVFRDRRYNKTSITDFNWAKSDVPFSTGDGANSDMGMCHNWHHDSDKTGTLTSESNQRLKPENLTLKAERDSPSFDSVKGKDTTNHDIRTDTVIPSVEETDNDINSTPPGRKNNPTPDPDNTPDTILKAHGGNIDTPALLAAFDHFWALYPLQDDREGAYREFVAAVKAGVDPDIIVRGCQRYVEWHASMPGTRLYKNPANWLRKKGWETKYPTQQPRKKSWDEELAECDVRTIHQTIAKEYMQ